MTPTLATIPAVPTVDSAELNWATGEVLSLLRRTDPDSVVGAVLQQTLNELHSLKPSAGTVVGPFRLKAA